MAEGLKTWVLMVEVQMTFYHVFPSAFSLFISRCLKTWVLMNGSLENLPSYIASAFSLLPSYYFILQKPLS